MKLVPFAPKPATPKTAAELHAIVADAQAQMLALAEATPDFYERYLLVMRSDVMKLELDVWRVALAQLCNALTTEKP